jgi:hypothetical protein
MIAGLPGTGIGGLFYLLASGWMALREGWSKLNRRRRDLSRSKVVKGQLLLGLVIVAVMWAMGEAIGRLLLLLPTDVLTRLLGPHALSHGKYNLWKTSIFYWTVGTLMGLYLLMHSLRLALKISGDVGTRRVAIDAPARAAFRGQIVREPLPALDATRAASSPEPAEERRVG